MNIHWKNWCWSWSSNNLPTWCEELTHWKRPWWWEGLKGGGEGDDRGWDGWMASLTWWTWIWVNSGSWWWIGRPGMLRFMGSQRVDMTEQLNWTELKWSGPNVGAPDFYLDLHDHVHLPVVAILEHLYTVTLAGFREESPLCIRGLELH